MKQGIHLNFTRTRVLSFGFLLLLCALPIRSFEQSNTEQPFFEQPYTLQHSDLNYVTRIFKDSHHIMWLGTGNGLYRYDGTNLMYFGRRSGDSTSLPNSKVLGIIEGKDNLLWVALLTGVVSINLNTLQCTSYTNDNKRFNVKNYTNRICTDDEGAIWVGNNLGIFKLDKKTNSFTNVWNNQFNGYPFSKYVTTIINNGKHDLIASTFHDIIFFNKDDHSFKRVPVFVSPPPKDSTINCVFLDSKQILWIGTWGGGIYTYDMAKNKLSHILNSPPDKATPFFYATSFYETSLGKQRIIWTSTSNGLIKCIVNDTGKSYNFTYITHDLNNENSIIPDKIESMYVDNDGALWCGGDKGVCKCFPFKNNFKTFASLPGLIQDIQQIKINNDTCYFLSSWGSGSGPGLLAVDKSGEQVYNNLEPHFTDPDDHWNISDVTRDKYNRLWVSSMAGVSVLDDKFIVTKQWNKNTTGDNNLSYHRTNGITIHNDTVWVICYHKGIDIFDLSFKKLGHFSDGDLSGLQENYISSFFTDSKGTLWLCGNTGLHKYLGKGKFRSIRITNEPGDNNPNELTENRNGNLIISTMSGLVEFDPKSERFSLIKSDLLEKEQNIPSAAIDKNGGIWFLTDKHVVHYKPNENRFILFGEEDGLDISKGLREIRTYNGTDFFVIQNNRVIKFNCDSLNSAGTPPYIELSMKANDSAIYCGNGNELYFPFNKNKLQFDFTGISYIKANQNQYYYQLSDVDKQWNITYKNAVSYANLAPGSYTFKVKTVNYAGMWSEDKIIHFTITPPYWQTWWFRLLTIMAILSVLFFIIRYISQRNLKERILKLEKETAVEKERNRIAQDMHDDLGSGLTRIAILSEVVKKQMAQPEKAFEQLNRISDSSRTLVDNLQDIIWMLNTKHDQLESLAVYIREYATKYFEPSGVKVIFDYPAQIKPIKIADEQRRNLFLAIKEALNNIAKHAEASVVSIGFSQEQNVIKFTICDDGKGFNTEETRQFANGLKNMQNRMKLVKGLCNIVSEQGAGTTINFSLQV